MNNTVTLACLVLLGAGVGLGVGCGTEAPPRPIVQGGNGGEGGAGGAGGGGPVTQGIISASGQSNYETDPQLAVNDDVVAVVWTGRLRPDAPGTIGYAISTNGGATFTDPQTIASPDLDNYVAPDVAVDNSGNVYLVFLGYDRGPDGAAIYFAHTNGGTTFGEPEKINDDMMVSYFGRPRLTLTNTNRLVVGYTETVAGVAELRVATKDQTGSEWTIQLLSQGGASRFFPTLCSAANTMNGRTYLVELVQGRIGLSRTEDNGDTWQGIQASADGDQVRGGATCIAQGDNVWVSYGVGGNNGLNEIKVAYSADGGATIMDVGVVSDPDIKAVHALHQLALEPPETGHLVFYNGAGLADKASSLRRVRFSPANLMQEPPLTPDDPPLGLPSVLVHEPVTLSLIDDDQRWLGSGIGLDFEGSELFVAYVDNSSGDSHVAFTVVDP